MHIMAIAAPRNEGEKKLLEEHHKLRARVFSGRLGWDVHVHGGHERDAFDDLGPTYILAVSEGDHVLGCARLLPAVGPTMVGDVFSSLLPDGNLHPHDAMIESSRFCVDTSHEVAGRSNRAHETTLAMFAGIVEWALLAGYTEIVTVTDLRFERILSRVEWPLRRIGPVKKIGTTTAVAGILPVSSLIFEKLQPANYCSMMEFRPTRPKERLVAHPSSHARLVRKLKEALGDQLCSALDDGAVVEVMLNPDGRLFIEYIGRAIAAAGEISASAAKMLIGTVAHALRSEVGMNQPVISGELPIGGHRFEGLLPPVVANPAFSIRRRTSRLIALDEVAELDTYRTLAAALVMSQTLPTCHLRWRSDTSWPWPTFATRFGVF
ncbi:N-acyl-L-homoserine lactone synthetase [Agrobacterium tumefaciens]|nr:N-acyl-L-homoserine lactone synthetase [Agrobacterium radiobacter]MBB4454793.1 N-acyl-L-homoserine lactone synthetase [Agrobacterium radiobacter]